MPNMHNAIKVYITYRTIVDPFSVGNQNLCQLEKYILESTFYTLPIHE